MPPEDIKLLTLKSLQDLANTLSISQFGTKPKLVTRIFNNNGGDMLATLVKKTKAEHMVKPPPKSKGTPLVIKTFLDETALALYDMELKKTEVIDGATWYTYLQKKGKPGPKPKGPKPVAPKPVAPKPVAPKPVAPKPVAPKPVAPKPDKATSGPKKTIEKKPPKPKGKMSKADKTKEMKDYMTLMAENATEWCEDGKRRGINVSSWLKRGLQIFNPCYEDEEISGLSIPEACEKLTERIAGYYPEEKEEEKEGEEEEFDEDEEEEDDDE
jgi:hypothetical protein